jgi:hypothetical protein
MPYYCKNMQALCSFKFFIALSGSAKFFGQQVVLSYAAIRAKFYNTLNVVQELFVIFGVFVIFVRRFDCRQEVVVLLRECVCFVEEEIYRN